MIVFTAQYWGDSFTVVRSSETMLYTATQADNAGNVLNTLTSASQAVCIAYLFEKMHSQAVDIDNGLAEVLPAC